MEHFLRISLTAECNLAWAHSCSHTGAVTAMQFHLPFPHACRIPFPFVSGVILVTSRLSRTRWYRFTLVPRCTAVICFFASQGGFSATELKEMGSERAVQSLDRVNSKTSPENGNGIRQACGNNECLRLCNDDAQMCFKCDNDCVNVEHNGSVCVGSY